MSPDPRGANGGGGGDGGIGVFFVDPGATLVNHGVIEGGKGGTGGAGSTTPANTTDLDGDAGADGKGGAGIVGTSMTVINSGTVTGGLAGDGVTQANAIELSGGGNRLELWSSSTISGNVVTSGGNNMLALGGAGSGTFDVTSVGAAAQYQGFTGFEKTGTGAWTLTGTTAETMPWTLTEGTLAISDSSNLGSPAGTLTFNGGTLRIVGPLFPSISNNIDWQAGGGGFDIADSGNIFLLSQALGGVGGLTKTGAGVLTLLGANAYTGRTDVDAGWLQAGGINTLSAGSAHTIAAGATLSLQGFDQKIGSLAGAGNVALGGTAVLTTGGDGTSTIFSGAIDGAGGSFSKTGAGTLTLSGLHSYTGATTIDGGVLEIGAGGSIASSSGTTVNSNGGGFVVNGTAGSVNVLGGYLGGSGTVAATVVGNGGALAPGNSIGTITVQDSLSFASGSTYKVEVSPTDADRTNVVAGPIGPGNADLSGATVVTTYEPGTYVAKQYTIVNAAGGLGGSEFAGLAGTAPTGFRQSLSYDANNAYLDLTLAMAGWSGLNQNQQAVADALTGYFNTTGGIPSEFAAFTPHDLTASTAGVGAGVQSAGMGAGALFIDTIAQPYAAVSSGANGGSGAQTAYAPEQTNPAPERFGRMAYGAEELSGTGNAAVRALELQHRLDAGYAEGSVRSDVPYSIWGAAIGGGISLAGNPAIGAQAVSGSVVGLASGFDWADGSTRAGFALGASWSSSTIAGLGSASLGNVSAGLRFSHDFDPAYLSGALAYGAHFASTSRSFGGETYTAAFTGHSVSARAEAGWRFRSPSVEVTPFIAGRLVSFSNPAYAETGSGAGTFALAYGAATNVETRSELGFRLNKTIDSKDGSRTAFSGMLGWAHYFTQAGNVTAGFSSLPGTRFITQGAAGASDTALVSLGVSHSLPSGLSLSLDANGEFGAGTAGYAARGRIGWRW